MLARNQPKSKTSKGGGRWLRRLGLFFVALLALPLLALALLLLWHRLNLPSYDGEAHLPGLERSVTVTFDRHAVPHIKAGSLPDASRALGYLHAQERLFQMEMNRRVGAGRLAEVVGPPALPFDRHMRILGLYRRVQADLALLPPDLRAVVDAYVDGVNTYLNSRPDPLPVEFHLLGLEPEPWSAADSLVWLKLMALQLSSDSRSELNRMVLLERLTPAQLGDLYPGVPADLPRSLAARDVDWRRLAAALPAPLGPSSASNAWVLDGSRTRSGAPLLANDPHLALTAPILWYLVRIETPEITHVGATVPGFPFMVLGSNQDIAFGLTTTGGDTQDLVLITEDPDDPDRYLTPAGSLPFTTRSETIGVRFGDDETLIVRETRHGPVISDAGDRFAATGHHVALMWPALLPGDTTVEGLFRGTLARDWPSFRDAMALIRAPQQNVHYADRSGRIALLAPGWIPLRNGHDGSLPVDGATVAEPWRGFIPFAALPQRVDPAEGLLWNTNNALVGPDYPHHIAHRWEDVYRARRADQLLTPLTDATRADMERILGDSVSMAARRLLPLMTTIPGDDARAQAALALLRGWDGDMRRALVAPSLFTAWLYHLGPALWMDELQADAERLWGLRAESVEQILRSAPQWCDRVDTDPVEDCATILTETLNQALAGLGQAHGDDMDGWRWGQVHKAPLPHRPFDMIPGSRLLLDNAVAVDGGTYTLNRAASHGGDGGHFPSLHGAGYRAIYDLADPRQSLFMIATGQSGRPMSPHYRDLTADWANNRHRRLWLDADALAAEAIGTLTFRP